MRYLLAVLLMSGCGTASGGFIAMDATEAADMHGDSAVSPDLATGPDMTQAPDLIPECIAALGMCQTDAQCCGGLPCNDLDVFHHKRCCMSEGGPCGSDGDCCQGMIVATVTCKAGHCN